ncbi:MAG TPA: hypothetical protein VEH27_07940 [Methylomirabilota bacterium]|nr:hypothetical protein [Methylomirabilota bacterium]
MLKWIVITCVLILLFGGMLLSGMLELAAGAVKLIAFLALALIGAAVFAGLRAKNRRR